MQTTDAPVNAEMPSSLAIVTAFYPPRAGGIERYAQGFARAARRMGLHVNVVTTWSKTKPELIVEDNGMNVLRVQHFTSRSRGASSRYHLAVRG